ncbi:MAG: phospholipase D family protein [Nitrospira sp.]
MLKKFRLLHTKDDLVQEFTRCCREYSSIRIAVAWCGNPNQTLPYYLLEDFNGAITATVGTSFNQTHPKAFEWFKHIGADIRVFCDHANLFHPKVYLFEDDRRYALFAGSSNLTYSGFYANIEVNVLIEGTNPTKENEVISLKKTLQEWRSPLLSFAPTSQWLNKYRKQYEKRIRQSRMYGIPSPSRFEEEIGTASWLRNADWPVYLQKVAGGLKVRERQGEGYYHVLDAASKNLRLPWQKSYFSDIEKRRIIGGMGEYGELGHVASSGVFRQILAGGTDKQHAVFVKAVNQIARLNPPIPWKQLQGNLSVLEGLGFTMKVWGRILCLVRPDLYCTVASISVRKNLSETLRVPQKQFERTAGYIQLIKLIHESPWFNSRRPKKMSEVAIWKRRAALLDAIFY